MSQQGWDCGTLSKPQSWGLHQAGVRAREPLEGNTPRPTACSIPGLSALSPRPSFGRHLPLLVPSGPQHTAGGCRLGATTLLLLLRIPHAQGSLREKLSYLGKNEQLPRPGKPAEHRLVIGVWPRLPVESRIQPGPSSRVNLTDI